MFINPKLDDETNLSRKCQSEVVCNLDLPGVGVPPVSHIAFAGFVSMTADFMPHIGGLH
jgi:hypothetical protein